MSTSLKALQEYTSSEDEETVNNNAKEKSKVKVLPIPKDIINNYRNTKDNNVNHQGRVRSFAHLKGNWPTHVYIPYQYELLEQLKEKVQLTLKDFSEWKIVDSFHVSLSRTFVLPYNQIQPIKSLLYESLRSENKFRIQLDPNDLRFYTNDEKTRSFLAFEINHSVIKHRLLELTTKVDNVLEKYKIEKYYKHPSFHLSVAWCLGVKSSSEELKTFKQHWNLLFTQNDDLFEMFVDFVSMKCGNKYMTFSLI